MTQASENISQQFIDGGVVPAKLAGQNAASKKYVDEQLAIRDTNIAAVSAVASAAQADIDAHEVSPTAHPAQNITYAGKVTGAGNVKQAIDAVKTTLDQAMISGDSGPEALAARYSTPQNITYPSLKDRLDASDVQLADLVYNVKKYGAKGDGSNDDTASIQTAIDAASAAGGGTVFFPKGTYIIKSTLQYRSKVNLIGCASRFCSNLVWNSEFGGVILDTTNVPTSQSVFENLAFYRGTIAHNAGAIVTGILGGSNFNVYNSGLAIFRNLLFHDLEYGIRGNGIIESSDIDAIGLFDCQFENLWFSDNSVGFWVHGSGNTVINSRFSGCNIGLYLDYLSRQSAAGVQLFGGVFAGNGYDISLPDARGIRSSSFFGVWFETSVSGIINIPFADTYVGALGFKNCVLSSDTPIFGLANFYNAVGVINIEGCNVIQSASSDVAIVRPNHINSKLKISNSWEKLSNGTERLLDDNAVDQRSYVHVFQSVKQSIGAATFTTVNFDSVVYDNQSEFDMALDRFVCKSSGIYQVFASVRLETQPAGNRALLAIYKNGASELVLYDENNGTSGVSALSGSGLIRMQKGDYLELKIHSTNAVSIAAGAYNSNYLQISKLSD